MSDTEVDYLQPGFEPRTLTMPRLRSILVSHNVQYPATAKKQQLVDIFTEQITPQAKKILAQRARAKRSSFGIVDIDSSEGTSISTTDDILMPPPNNSRARSPRKASSRLTRQSEEPEHLPEPSVSSRKRQSRSTSRQLAQSDTDTDSLADARRSPRKPRRTTQYAPEPGIKVEESEEDMYNTRQAGEPEAVFSNDNPFQSGSSPLPAKTPSNRRKTAHGTDSTVKRSTSSTLRRRTNVPQDDGADSKISKSIELPLSKPARPHTPQNPRTPEPVFEAGEEFTPEEQFALEQEDAVRAQTAVVPHRPKKRSSNLVTPVWVLVMTLLSAYVAWYRQEKVAAGYCGVGRPTQQIVPREFNVRDMNLELPEWAVTVVETLTEPECEPCPSHAFCYSDYSVRCEDDYILKPHPLSAGGLVPLPPTCEPDGEKVRRVKAVADKAVEELRERKAKFECGELVDEEGHKRDTPAIAVDELKQTVSDKRSKKLSQKDFDDLWVAALGEIETRDEVEVEAEPEAEPKTTGSGRIRTTRLSSTSLARLPLTCAIRRSTRDGLERHRLSIISVVLTILSALYGQSRYKSYRATAAQIPALVDLVLGRLASQKELAYEDEGENDSFLFLPNMRDDVLRTIHSLSERERIWQRVRAVVEQNSNVRTAQREGQNGEVGRAWEWIGPITAGDNSARRRRTGQVSFGADVKDAEETPTTEKSGLHKKWEEPGSRPVY